MVTSRFRVETPLGPLTLATTVRGLRSLTFAAEESRSPGDVGGVADSAARALAAACARQLDDYFAGARERFELPLDLHGTAFQLRVWGALCEIPYGATCSYAEQAAAIGAPAAVRAVGAANARNPIAVVVPCHRVVGADGALTGYAGGLARKRALLTLEGSLPPRDRVDPGRAGSATTGGRP